MKRSFKLLAIIFMIATSAYAYRWPFEASSGPHPVHGTLGEFRTGHLHSGVDMTPTGGPQTGTNATKIYAIEGCEKAIIGNKGENNELGDKRGRNPFKYIDIS